MSCTFLQLIWNKCMGNGREISYFQSQDLHKCIGAFNFQGRGTCCWRTSFLHLWCWVITWSRGRILKFCIRWTFSFTWFTSLGITGFFPAFRYKENWKRLVKIVSISFVQTIRHSEVILVSKYFARLTYWHKEELINFKSEVLLRWQHFKPYLTLHQN